MKAILVLATSFAIVLVAIPVEVPLGPELRVIVDIAGDFCAFVAGATAIVINQRIAEGPDDNAPEP